MLDPKPGERVLDLCAAPGIKATAIAARMRNQGEIVAVELDPGRARQLRELAERLGAVCIRVVEADAASADLGGGYDRILVDPPCSDLGALASRPDARWRKSPELIERLARIQEAILRRAAAPSAPGARSSTRPARSPCARTRSDSRRCSLQIPRCGPTIWAPPTPSSPPARAPLPADAARPRPHRRVLHRPASPRRGRSRLAEGGLSRWLRKGEGRRFSARSARAAASPGCARPSCPAAIRCVYCLRRYELVSQCPNCGEHQTIVRMSTSEDMLCQHCGGSMLKPV